MGKDDPSVLWTSGRGAGTIPKMARHLRLVKPHRTECRYVVARTVHVRPGTPYVLADCADHAVAAVLSMSGHTAHSEREMRNGPELARALDAWEAGDHRLHRLELAAARAFAGRGTSSDSSRRRLLHPSLLGRSAAVAAGPPAP
jgi:hypothetical protein